MKTNRISHPLAVVPAALVALALSIAVIAGCGGSKKEEAAQETPATQPAVTTDTSSTSGGETPTADAGLVEQGAAVYAKRCTPCHGPSGHGDGPAAKALNPKPRNHHDAAYMNSRTDEQLLTVIRDGKGAMPAWGKVLTEDEMKAVLAYVRTLSKTP